MTSLASSLNGWDHRLGTVSVHSFNENHVDEGEPRMGSGYYDKLKPVSEDFGAQSSASEEEVEDEEEEDEDESD